MLSSPVLRVILFLAPLCPICQNMSYDLRQLEAEFADAPVEFLGVFPNASTRQDQIDVFRETYDLKMDLVMDDEDDQLDARWTPEAFVLDEHDSVLYRGRINDRYFAPGRRKNKTRHRDLRDAISDAIQGEEVRTPLTEAVGCPIEGIKLTTPAH